MKPRVLFINLLSEPYDDIIKSFTGELKMNRAVVMPLGILYLSAFLKKHGYAEKIGILDFPVYFRDAVKYCDIDDFIKVSAKHKVNFVPDILAFSINFSISHRFLIKCLEVLKSFWPYATTIVGGIHATNCTMQLLESARDIDYIVRGEGEIAFCQFVDQFYSSNKRAAKNKSFQQPVNIKGIYNRKDIYSGKTLELCEYVTDLDQLPFPDWELIDMNFYTNSRGRARNIGGAWEKKIASIMTTRGCPFQCTFCSSHTVHGRLMRYRSIENVLEEVKTLYKLYDVRLFVPEDDLFTANHRRTIKLLGELKKLNIPNLELQFPNALSINTLNKEVMDALIDTGMKVAQLAVESGSEYVQKNIIKKNCNLEKTKSVVKYFKEKGIMVRCYFLFGFPGETIAMMMESINFARQLEADWCTFFIATPLIGSEMYNQFVARGEIMDDINLWSKAFYEKRVFDTEEITAKELNELVYRANLEVNFIYNYNLINGYYQKAIDIFNDILITAPFHIIALNCLIKCYSGLDDFNTVQKIKERIFSLLKTNEKSREMFVKYQDLIPELAVEMEDVLADKSN